MRTRHATAISPARTALRKADSTGAPLSAAFPPLGRRPRRAQAAAGPSGVTGRAWRGAWRNGASVARGMRHGAGDDCPPSVPRDLGRASGAASPAPARHQPRRGAPPLLGRRFRLKRVLVGSEGPHGLDGAGEQLVKLPAEHLGAAPDDVAVDAGGETLVFELLLE